MESRINLFILSAEKNSDFFFFLNRPSGLRMSGNNRWLYCSSPEILLVLLCLTFPYLAVLLASSSGKLGGFMKQKRH